MTIDGKAEINIEVEPIPEGKRNETGGKRQGLQGEKLKEAKEEANENSNAWKFG